MWIAFNICFLRGFPSELALLRQQAASLVKIPFLKHVWSQGLFFPRDQAVASLTVAFNPCHYSGDVVESAIEVGKGVKKLASLESLKGRKYQKALNLRVLI